MFKPDTEKPFFKKINEMVRALTWGLAIALLIRTFLFSPFNIPSGSMVPTLLIGDYLFVSKYTYGFSKYSFPFSPNLFSGRIMFSPPQRGDVIVFRPPQDPMTDWIKRVVGLPGDRIQMIEGILHINGVPVQLEKAGPYAWRDKEGRAHTSTLYYETLPNGVRHKMLKSIPFGQGKGDHTPEYIVPKGHYFMLGDNRDHSSDSRFMYTLGFIPRDNLVGRAEALFFSTEIPTYRETSWWHFWKWPFMTRFLRFFNLIR